MRAGAMDDPIRLLSIGGAGWTMAGLTCAAKASGVLACAGLSAFGIRRRAAATRHLVWALGLAGALAVLPLACALPCWSLPLLSASEQASMRGEGPSSVSGRDEIRTVAAVVPIAEPEAGSGLREAHASPGQAARPDPVTANATWRVVTGAWP